MIAMDTMGVSAMAYDNGLPPGPSEHMFSVHVRPTGPWEPDSIHTFCVDTAFYPPSVCQFCYMTQQGAAIMFTKGNTQTTWPVKLLCGNPNGDNDVNVGDAVFMVNYVFKNGPAPNPWQLGDANCDGTLDVGDVVFLIAASFRYGPQPECPE
jgi:hypothetical protein